MKSGRRPKGRRPLRFCEGPGEGPRLRGSGEWRVAAGAGRPRAGRGEVANWTYAGPSGIRQGLPHGRLHETLAIAAIRPICTTYAGPRGESVPKGDGWPAAQRALDERGDAAAA
jgi:hypothetical protein